MTFKITIHYYELAQCVGIDLYDTHPRKRDRQAIYKQVNTALQRCGLKLTKRPYWMDKWEVTAIDGWKAPAVKIYNSHWHFQHGSEERHDFEKMPSHVFVDKYLGYLKHVCR